MQHYNTQGTIHNNLQISVFYSHSNDYNGKENPRSRYPRKLVPMSEVDFEQVEDVTKTTSGAVVYTTQNPAQNNVNIIIAWKNSSNGKQVFTKIQYATEEINWDYIQMELSKSTNDARDERLGLSSVITWNPSSPNLDATFGA